MEYIFKCKGNSNILGTHPRTIEFSTKDSTSLEATQVLGVNASFVYSQLKDILSCNRIKVILLSQGFEDSFECNVNPLFISKESITFRKSNYESDKTFGVDSTKGANEIDKQLVNSLKKDSARLHVILRKID